MEVPTYPLRQLVTIVGGGTPSKRVASYWEGGNIPWVSPKDMKTESITDAIDHITQTAVDESSTKLIPEGSVLVVTRSGILRHTFPIAVTKREVALNQDLKALIPNADLLPEYLMRVLKGKERDILQHCAKDGTTVNSIDTTLLSEVKIPLPDLPTQRAIVERLDALHSELDAGVASLERAKAKLKVYRQSVLQRAFSGELTRAWRERQTDLPTSEELLAEIRAAREAWYAGEVAKYEEDYRAWVAGGEVGRKPRKVGKLKAVELNKDGTVPLGAYLVDIEAGNSFRCRESPPGEGEIGVAKVSAVSWGKYNQRESKTCMEPERVDERLIIRNGDFLISRANTVELVGAAVIAKQVTNNVMLSDKTLRLTFVGIAPEYILWFLRSPQGRKQIEELSSGNQESMRNISQSTLSHIKIPVMYLEEQQAITSWLSALMREHDQLKSILKSQNIKSKLLR